MASPSIIDSLDNLEVKINHLQKRIVGADGIKPENGLTIEEILLRSDAATEEAASSHSHIKDLLKRRSELEGYLDPTFWDSYLDTVTKTQIILDAQDELRETIRQLKRLNELTAFANTESFQSLPDSKTQLACLTAGVLELQEQSNTLKSAVRCLVTKYINVVTYTNQVMLQLCCRISEIEASLDQVKPRE